jgi:hypothetical protein
VIKPLEPCDIANPFFVALDIENWPNGDVITIAIAWRDKPDGEIETKIFDSWQAFWSWFVPKARDDRRFRTVYAHNGGGWDWLSLAHFLLTDGAKSYISLFASTAASKMITLTVQMESRFSVHFCDSLQLLRSPLATLAKKFNVTRKVETDGRLPHEVWEQNRSLYWEYVRSDVIALVEILEKGLVLIRENVARISTFGYTIGSTALKIFKTMGLDEPISIPWDDGLREFLREGYRGGRVECFKGGHFPRVRVYDVNSLYPYAMLSTEVPTSARGQWVAEYDPDIPCGAYRIHFWQINHDIPPVLMVNGVGAYSGEGVYFANEIALLREVDPCCKVGVKSGYVFHDSEKVFQNYVNTLYNLRLSDPDGPISLLAKYLLNSLYGKFGQHAQREKIIRFTDPEEVRRRTPKDGESPFRELSSELGTHVEAVESDCLFEHVGIAGTITSAARCLLYRGMLSAGVENVVYCDTDSVHTTASLSSQLVGKEIGKFKLEFEGEGVYCGKKLYALRDNCGNTYGWNSGNPVACQYPPKIRAKGVSVGGRNGSRIGFADFLRMAEGESLECLFQQPKTALQVFSGGNPCEFGPRKRTIKRLAN